MAEWHPNIRTSEGKEQIFCDWRRKFVRLTPEEWVRQHFLHFLVEEMQFPKARIAVEHPISVGDVQKRCDAVVMGAQLQPLCIIEFKADNVALTQKVFDQVAVYNRKLCVNYFILNNGKQTFACQVTPAGYTFLHDIPTYNNLSDSSNITN